MAGGLRAGNPAVMTCKALAVVALLALAACRQSGQSQATTVVDPIQIPPAVAAALADPGRAMHRAADARRRPGEIVAFTGVGPGDKVLDLIPGDGYWTRIFSRIVGPEGRVYAVWPVNYARVAQGNVRSLREIAASPAYANVRVEVQPSTILTAPEPLDLVFTAQNYHDYPDEFMGRTDPDQLNRAVSAMLRPGGTWFIVDHAARPGSGLGGTERLHRIDPAEVRRQVEAAGFVYEGESRILANPADDRSLPVFDPAVRGRTDQFVMRFRKPG